MQKTIRGLLSLFVLGAMLCGPAVAQEQAEVRIGTDGGYLPWTSTTPSGELTGFEIDLAKQVCDRMKRSCRFTAQPWEG